MPPQCARGKAQSRAGSRLNQLSGGFNDFQKPTSDLEIADSVGRQPFEIVVLVVQDRLPGGPARRKRHDQIMPAAFGRRQHLAPSRQVQNFDSKPGFLVDLAVHCGVQRFTEFDPAARERIEALAQRAGATNQQNLAVAKDRAADGKLWTGGVKRRNRREIRNWTNTTSGSCPKDAPRSNSEVPNSI